ncbi:hypothetical protein [Leucobacter exalbidus]|uniref:hypothetical protein n=1 Tax=Leucobacter exalbidus TaxID=662960 RepID=UPI001AE639BB|nr:hypothetical protein [Leucobacter exalbidus]
MTPVYADAHTIDSAIAFLETDYEPLQSNREVAEISDVIVQGKIVTVREGPQYGRLGDDLTDLSSVVIEVQSENIVQGTLAGDTLYVSMLSPAGNSIADWNRGLPAGVDVVVYAEQSSEGVAGETGEIDTNNWGAGRPDGAALYLPQPQGFVVQTGENRLVWPLTGVTREATFADALPGDTAVGVPLPGEGTPALDTVA